MNIYEISKSIALKSVNIEDSAVAQYIKSQADYLQSKGEDLRDYQLVRSSGNYELDDDTNRVGYNVTYRLVHKDKLIKVVFSEDE